MKADLLAQARALTIDEQIELVEAIWGSIIASGDVPPPSKAQQDELERRLKRHLDHPHEVMSLEEVNAAVVKA